MYIKKGVSLAGLTVQMVLANSIVERVYDQFNREGTITSGEDGEHSTLSLHYSGNALDYRIKNPVNGTPYFEDPQEVVRRIKDRLGGDFDVLLETDHIHVEYQPRRK